MLTCAEGCFDVAAAELLAMESDSCLRGHVLRCALLIAAARAPAARQQTVDSTGAVSALAFTGLINIQLPPGPSGRPARNPHHISLGSIHANGYRLYKSRGYRTTSRRGAVLHRHGARGSRDCAGWIRSGYIRSSFAQGTTNMGHWAAWRHLQCMACLVSDAVIAHIQPKDCRASCVGLRGGRTRNRHACFRLLYNNSDGASGIRSER